MQAYRKLLVALKREFGPFTARRTRIGRNDAGDCRKIGDTFLIRIDRALDEQAAMDTLVHEVAHMLAWGEYSRGVAHGRRWAGKYAECYRVYERVCLGNP